MKKIEIYIHIPFCVRKCAYCDFLSGPSCEAEREEYVKLLCEEILLSKGRFPEYEVSSIFLGGGTPSILTGEQIHRIMDMVRTSFVLSSDCEISMEMNPGTVTREKLYLYKEAGINRISIGAQSLKDEDLKILGRIHDKQQFLQTFRMARECGFDNINVDLMSAIPGQTVRMFEENLEEVISLSPEHISAYSLIIEEGTPFYELYGEGKKQDVLPLPDEEEERTIYHRTKEILEEAGYLQYEISNYAKPGYACRHNLGYWERVPYLGFGLGAASLLPKGSGMARYSNPDTLEEYRSAWNEKYDADLLSKEEEMEEFMFLGLRKNEGVSEEAFFSYFDAWIDEIYGKQLEKFESLNLLERDGGRIYLTDRGRDVSNQIFVEFLF